MEGDGVWRGGHAYGGLMEGGSEEEGRWVGAWWAAVLYQVDLKGQRLIHHPLVLFLFVCTAFSVFSSSNYFWDCFW